MVGQMESEFRYEDAHSAGGGAIETSKRAIPDGSGLHLLVDRLSRFRRIDEQTIAALHDFCAEPMHVQARSEVAAAGDSSAQLHLLLKGWAFRSRDFPDGRRQITALLLPGEICDLDNLYIAARNESLSTLTDCEIATVPRASFRSMMERDAALADVLGWIGARENVRLGEYNASLGKRSGRERVAHLLCELYMRLNEVGESDGKSCRVPLTQEQIGEALGLTSVHVNRVLKGLRDDNLVEKHGDLLTIMDWERLAAEGGFSAGYLHLSDTEPASSGTGGAPNESTDAEAWAGAVVTLAQDPDALMERAELKHRFKNFVATAQSLVSHSLRGEMTLGDAKERLNDRLSAMGGAIDVLASGNWETGDLRKTIGKALSISGAANERIQCSGPDLCLRANAVMAISMALHELQTNAMKYGALSAKEGSVELFWKVLGTGADARFWMQWAERGGPPVTAPEREGFGTRLLKRGTSRPVSGEAQIDYTPDGLTWILTAPLERVTQSSAAP